MLELVAEDKVFARCKDTGAYVERRALRMTLIYRSYRLGWKLDRRRATDLEMLSLAQVTLDKLTGQHVQEEY